LQGRLVEMLRGLSEAPDAVRDRFDAFRKARPETAPAARFALALSGWLVGADAALDDPAATQTLAVARDALTDYLASAAVDESTRIDRLATLRGLQLPGGKPINLETLTRIVRLMPPPLQTGPALAAGKVKLLRVRDDPNPNQPTEYAVLLPHEYQSLRSYPALVVLHGDETPDEAVQTWANEATRRGFIVLAPEYNLSGRGRHYHYSAAEHAAVELALRDALRRFAIDPDRVFLAGQLFGGNMAWDFGLAHPDLFAGVAILSGLPEKYPWAYRTPNARLVPLYIVNGDLAPAEDALVFNMMAKPLISKNYEIIYIKYSRRGLEAFPEEVPNVFDWMNGRRRDPAPATFEAVSARESDDRFYGLVIRSFEARRATPPEVADPLGKNLHPATLEFKARSKANLLLVTARGVRQLDLWLSPRLFDFDQKLEIRVNNRTLFKGQAQPDLGAFLEDLRIRGDRQQVYWLRLSYPPVRGK
jgi:acetyl esterase/lipase